MDHRFSRIWFAFLALALLLCAALRPPAYAQTPPDPTSAATASSTEELVPEGPSRADLEQKIKERAQALETVNKQIEELNQNLQETKNQKTSLQKEVNTLDQNISQLELSIQSDQIANQKLALEIDSVTYDMRDIQITVANKGDAIEHLLRELQKAGEPNILTIFLRNGSLANSVWETQSLKNLRGQLTIDIDNLTNLEKQLQEKAKLVISKKNDIENHQQSLAVKKVIVLDQKEDRKIILAQAKNKESVYQKQLAELKVQQDAISDEISQAEEKLRASFDVSLLPGKRPGVFAWPTKMKSDGGVAVVTQHFGEKSNLYRGRPHNGLDIGAPVGTPIMAADDGVVIAVDNNDKSTWSKYQYGKYVMIKHMNNLTTLYGHMSKHSVTKGQQVKRGDVIGYVGATGYATGAHLHFGVYWSASVLMKSVPPAAGLVPVGVVIAPEDYL